MNLDQAMLHAQQQDRLKIDKLMLIIGLAHLPVTMFLAPMGYGTSSFAIVASLIVAAIGIAGYFLLRGTRGFGVLAGAGFMLMSAILIQSQLGRIEMHFHIFVALALMLIYRDWLTIVVPAGVIAVHHLAFTGLQLSGATIGGAPLTLFNYGCSWNIAILHAVFVVLEAAALIYFAVGMRKERDTSLASAATIELVSQTGTYQHRVAAEFHSVTTEALNSMLAQIQQGLGEVTKTLSSFTNRDYSARVTGQYQGDLGVLANDLNVMGERTAIRSAQNYDYASQIEAINRSMAVVEFDLQGNIQKANDNFLKSTGYRSEEVVGKHHRMFVEPAEASSSAYQQFWAKLARGEHVAGTFKRHDKKGGLLWLEASYNPVLDANGKPYKVVKFASDVTRNEHTIMLERAIDESAKVLDGITNGDLTQRVQGQFEGRLEALKVAVNTTAGKLSEVVNNVVEAAHVVSSGAGQVSQGAGDLSGRVQEQSASLEQASATMTRMNNAVTENTHQAQQAALKAQSVRSQADEGASVMRQTIEAMSAIRESSHKISDIVSLIDGIAFQTNLLALNAAVEAARAGEHGRGFAVVAGEVRALAQKSADAAKDIKGLITDSVNRIEAGTQLADRSGEVLNAIAASVGDVTATINNIANASVEQAAGIHEVHQAVSSIERVTQENAALVEETTASAESMSEQANRLQQNMAFFKTGSNYTAPRATPAQRAPAVKPRATTPAAVKKPAASLPSPSAASKDEWSEF